MIGAGMAGASCARWMADAGLEVQVFDKSRGVGGRMPTWRASTDAGGAERQARSRPRRSGLRLAHARVRSLRRAGRPRRPVVALGRAGGARQLRALDEPGLWVPVPDMLAWCRAMLAGLPVHTACTVEALRHTPAGWTLVWRIDGR
ncbi:MAG: NAD(P)-binding protein [Chromatiales bacterium]|nr:NAD(P)-binding protein [Chromatiales bacterium]